MIISGAATSAYDENEVYITIQAEEGECIHVGDMISIPMNDHTFVNREITAMYRDWKKWNKGKGLFTEIRAGEWAECIIHDIHSGRIHTISSPYDEELDNDGWVTTTPIEEIQKYRFKYWFEWGCDEKHCACLWSVDQYTKEKFDYGVDLKELPISENLRTFLFRLGIRHDKALDWSNPAGPLLWTSEEERLFYKLAKKGYEKLCSELGAQYEIEYCEVE